MVAGVNPLASYCSVASSGAFSDAMLSIRTAGLPGLPDIVLGAALRLNHCSVFSPILSTSRLSESLITWITWSKSAVTGGKKNFFVVLFVDPANWTPELSISGRPCFSFWSRMQALKWCRCQRSWTVRTVCGNMFIDGIDRFRDRDERRVAVCCPQWRKSQYEYVAEYVKYVVFQSISKLICNLIECWMTGITVDHKLAVGEVRDTRTHEHNTQNTHTNCSHTHTLKHADIYARVHTHTYKTLSHTGVWHTACHGWREVSGKCVCALLSCSRVFSCYRVFFFARLRVILIWISNSPGQRITTKPKRIQLALPSARQGAGRANHHRTLVKVWWTRAERTRRWESD